MYSIVEPNFCDSIFLYLTSALYWQFDLESVYFDNVYLHVPANRKKFPSYKLYQEWLVAKQVQSSEIYHIYFTGLLCS